MNKKILIATGIYPPDIGGPATYSKELAKILKDQWYDVCILTYSNINISESDKDLKYKLIRIKRTNKLLNYIKYFIALCKNINNYDVVYAFDYFSAGIPSLIVSKLFGKKIMIRIGGDFIWERYLNISYTAETLKNYYELGLYKKDLFRFFIIKFVLKSADRLVFTTNFQKQIFEKYYNLKSDRISVINNPVFFDSNIGDLADDIKNNEIICPGRMINKNNLERLIDIFLSIKQDNFVLRLIGDGPMFDKLKEKSDNKKIFIENSKNRNELMGILKKCRAVVLPSYTDISPNTAIECLFLQTPFVITKEHGFDWLRGKVLEFDPLYNEEIKKALENIMNEDFYLEYLKKVKNINYNYKKEDMLRDTIKLFEEIL
ncbi:MAG: glycosyltransferase family 4 protein [Patescibacteria group bacterium]|nr:glycosyltransferase family 4 protein [Patescibacteria group bacterium]MDD4304274.1 glycosyltransferase family 4 protein [Patescibacteria group bacterium]MDD4695328.1 glycosyltransferase family 4 protein [Patescibacteria group bacterium]